MKIKSDKDAFDLVRSKLLAQGQRSMNYSTHTCSYRGYSEKIYEDVLNILYEIHPEMDDHAKAIENVDISEVEIYITRNNVYDLKCAVGHLIEDKYYDGDLEGDIISAWNDDLVHVVVMSNPEWEIGDSSIELMQALQKIHDDIKPSNWAEAFNKIENNFDSHGNFISVEESVLVES